ncbi:hypothetical protein [Pararhodobacter sp.]|uniref:hypothetical protein n=1 Tax=Pararhodobacter sp. TaxID=2127056 RepID=UPI002FDEB462
MPTTAVHLSKFLPYTALHAPGAPIPTIESYLRLAAIEFCERTRCWRHMVNVELTDENHVAVVAPPYAAIHAFEYAAFIADNGPRRPLLPTQYSDLAPEGFPENAGALPNHITQATPNSITIFPFAAGEVELSVFLKPRFGQDFNGPDRESPIEDAYDKVPEFLLTQWGEAIAVGALSKLLIVPQQRWTDQKTAMTFLARFERYCDQHFSSNVIGQQRAPRRSRFSYL